MTIPVTVNYNIELVLKHYSVYRNSFFRSPKPGMVSIEVEFNPIVLTEEFWKSMNAVIPCGVYAQIVFYRGVELFGICCVPSKQLRNVILGKKTILERIKGIFK